MASRKPRKPRVEPRRVDPGSVILEGSREFWEEIERRRAAKGPRRTVEQVRADLSVPSRGRAKKAG